MRSLADDLRARGDDELAALVRARPDLLQPVPADVTALAQRAGSPASIAACLRGYDQLALHVVLAAALGPDPVRPAELVRTVAPRVPGRAAAPRVRTVVDRMRADALLWGRRHLHLVGPARDLIIPADRGPSVAALDPVVAGYAAAPDSLRTLLAAAPDGVWGVLDKLLAGPVVGSVLDARRVPDPERGPVDWLLASHVLIPLGADRVVLPAEVVTILRATGTAEPALRVIDLAPPGPSRGPIEADTVDPAAVGAILDVLHRTGDLARTWARTPPARLRAGGISARDLTRTARALAAGETETALLIEVSAAAGLLATDPDDQVSVVPTAGFDPWAALPPGEQHAALLRAWLAMPRGVPGAGQRPLAPTSADPGLPELRRDVLRILAGAPGGWSDDDVVRAVDWWAPRRHDATRAERVRAILSQARTLGVLVDGALTSAGRALDGDEHHLAEVLGRSLPEPVDSLILQADLTAIVPGLPTPQLADLLRTMADAESVGAASTYRFSAASVRRALDSGRTSQELLGELGRRAVVPQPLAYLVEDVARRHAVLRVGPAATFLRCDDPVLLAQILADPAAAALGLQALCDTVVVSPAGPEQVLERLRSLGHAPVPQPGTGSASRGPRRTRGSDGVPEMPDLEVSAALAAAAVRAIRANDRPGATGPVATGGAATSHPIPAMTPPEITAVLRSAITAGSAVWIGYADPTGVAGDRRVEPLRLAGGYLTALDQRSQAIRTFSLARITGVAT